MKEGQKVKNRLKKKILQVVQLPSPKRVQRVVFRKCGCKCLRCLSSRWVLLSAKFPLWLDSHLQEVLGFDSISAGQTEISNAERMVLQTGNEMSC